MRVVHTDLELVDWILNLDRMHAGSFLRAIGDAAMHADGSNYELMRPLLLELKRKYPDYANEKENTNEAI